MKRICTLLLSLTAVLLVAGTALAGPLTVATDTNFPPFEFRAPNGQQTGFDIQLWDAIAKKIGLAYKLQPMDFNAILPGLENGRFDVGLSGITITPERAKVVDFSDGYYRAGLRILVRGDENDIHGVKDLYGKVVATKLGTTSADFVRARAHAGDIKLFPNQDAMFLELLSGGVDAVVFDSPVIANFMRKTEKGRVKVVGPLYMRRSYGIAFPKGSPLVPKVNAALKELRADGTYAALYRQWFRSDPR
jgi:glutamine transport system substrate-binding protein